MSNILVTVVENAEKKISIQLLNDKYFYGNFNSNFSLQNKKLQQMQLILKRKKITFN